MAEDLVSRRNLSISSIVELVLMLKLDIGIARAQAPQAISDSANSGPQSVVAAAVAVSASSPSDNQSANNAIPPGTSITMQNWQQYQQFMPDGMAAFFQGRYF